MIHAILYHAFVWIQFYNGFTGEQSVNSNKWIAAYTKLGGVAFILPDQQDTIAIQKLQGKGNNVEISLLRPPSGIRKVTLQGHEISNSDLEYLHTWQNLESIEIIDGKSIDDVGISWALKNRRLKELRLYDTNIGMASFAKMSNHQSLEILEVSNAAFQISLDYVNIEKIENLSKIRLNISSIRSLKIATLPNLTEIELSSTKIKHATVADIPKIEELDFSYTEVELFQLTNAPKLRRLNLKKTKITTKDFETLSNLLPKIEILR
jgi:hypothetical protein